VTTPGLFQQAAIPSEPVADNTVSASTPVQAAPQTQPAAMEIIQSLEVDANETLDASDVMKQLESFDLDINDIDTNNDGRIDKNELKKLLDDLKENAESETPLTLLNESSHILSNALQVSEVFRSPHQQALNNLLTF